MARIDRRRGHDRLDADGGIDVDELQEEPAAACGSTVKIGTFSAASNVTGIVTDVDRIAVLLHRHGALSCWDYAPRGRTCRSR